MTRGQFEGRFQPVALEEYVKQVVAVAPPLTDQQRSRLAELLRPVRRTAGQTHGEVAAA